MHRSSGEHEHQRTNGANAQTARACENLPGAV
jgi:hypothetical protein